MLVAVVAIVTFVILFAGLALLVTRDEPSAFDAGILMALRAPGRAGDPLGPPWLEEAARDVTALGSNTVLILLFICTCCYLLLQRRPQAALYMALTIAGAVALSYALKATFDRPRPDLVAHHAQVFTSSFPSSHAMASAATFLVIGMLLARAAAGTRLKAFILGTAALLTLIIGASRVYLGVHWPSDVLAGWAAGAAWALLAWVFAVSWQGGRKSIDVSLRARV